MPLYMTTKFKQCGAPWWICWRPHIYCQNHVSHGPLSKTWRHPQDWKYIKYCIVVRRSEPRPQVTCIEENFVKNGSVVFEICVWTDTQTHRYMIRYHHHHNHFMALFTGPPRWAGARRKLLLDFMVLGRIIRGRHTDNPGGCHSIHTNQQSTSINPHFYARCPSCCNPPNLFWLGTGTGICWIAYPRGLVWFIPPWGYMIQYTIDGHKDMKTAVLCTPRG